MNHTIGMCRIMKPAALNPSRHMVSPEAADSGKIISDQSQRPLIFGVGGELNSLAMEVPE